MDRSAQHGAVERVTTQCDGNGRRGAPSDHDVHVIVLPGGGYSEHVAHEAEPIAGWLSGLGVRASVFRYPLLARHPVPLDALQAEIRKLRDAGARVIGLMGFSAGGHLAGLAALSPGERATFIALMDKLARQVNGLHVVAM